MAFEVDRPSDRLKGRALNKGDKGVQVANLSFAYPGKPQTQVLRDISFNVPEGSRVLLAGATGSGKSTLLRCLKPELTPNGEFSGEILIGGKKIQDLSAQVSAGHIGYVMQDPHQQIVMDTVKAELAFGLENLGVPSKMIQRRVAEIAHYFGINAWVERSTSELSGGEKQLLNLAAIIAMQPRTLLLDEPTVGLDPIAAREFLELVQRVNEELGITLVLAEHRQEDVLSNMNHVLYLDEGKLAFNGNPREFAAWLHSSTHANYEALPVASRLYLAQAAHQNTNPEVIPLDVREGRWWLWQHREEAPTFEGIQGGLASPSQRKDKAFVPRMVLKAKHLWYRYSKEDPYVLKDLSLDIAGGRILGIVGANASGKSTLLSVLSGTAKPQHGKVWHDSEVHLGTLPQDPTTLFIHDTVHEELMDHAARFCYGLAEVQEMLERMRLQDKVNHHPFDLSGGEQQKLALGKLLLANPSALLLDEPTKGLDSRALRDLTAILKYLSAQGKTILMVSHDLEFVARTTDECVMLFDGAMIGRSSTQEFFAGNMFYTTALRRITQGILEDCPPVLLEHPSLYIDESHDR